MKQLGAIYVFDFMSIPPKESRMVACLNPLARLLCCSAATLGAATGYPVWVWADRLFLQKPHANWPFGLIATLTCMLLVVIIMITPRTRNYFGLRKEVHEHE